MELRVRPRGRPVSIPEAAGLEQGRGHRPASEHDVLQARPHGAVQLDVVVVGVIAGALRDGVDVEVILEVLADAGKVVSNRHADRAQVIGRADARKQ